CAFRAEAGSAAGMGQRPKCMQQSTDVMCGDASAVRRARPRKSRRPLGFGFPSEPQAAARRSAHCQYYTTIARPTYSEARFLRGIDDFLSLRSVGEVLGQRLPGLPGLQQRIGTQRIDRGLEVLEGVEALIDAGEAQVGDLVEFAQRIEDGQPHFVGIDLGDALRADVLLDPLRQLRAIISAVRPPLAGLAHSRHDLLPRELLGPPGAFDRRQARGLHRREAATAVAALSPPADRGAVFAGPRVDDPRVGLTTEGTTHLYSSNLMSTARPWAGSCSLAARASMCSATSARAPR